MVKIYAFYLPQFHRTPENDEWWGNGFTEWTAVKNARPLFPKHHQPHEPISYYDLLDKKTMENQAYLMRKYGLDGMCFYHYYFENGKKVLEKPAENLLKWNDIDMAFCFYWANESWIHSWSNINGGNKWASVYDHSDNKKGNEILIKQDYGQREQWEEHFYYLLPFFKDSRYIKKDGRPLFIIYKPEDITCLDEMMNFWNDLMKKEGMQEIYFIGKNMVLDGALCHEPGFSMNEYAGNRFNNEYGVGNIIQYDDIWEITLQHDIFDVNYYSCGYPGYDDTPRHGKSGSVIIGSTPKKFYDYMVRLLIKAEKNKSEFVFINAWNEWGEGMYLEPDVEWGNAYLKALYEAKKFVFENSKVLLGMLKDNENRSSEKKRKVESVKEKRYREYFQILNKWLRYELQGKSIVQYLKNRSVESVAVYGLGMLGGSLVMELEKGGIAVKYGIDQDVYKGRQFDFPVYTLEDTLPEVQMIIVTTTIVFISVKNKLKSKSSAEILSIKSILE